MQNCPVSPTKAGAVQPVKDRHGERVGLGNAATLRFPPAYRTGQATASGSDKASDLRLEMLTELQLHKSQCVIEGTRKVVRSTRTANLVSPVFDLGISALLMLRSTLSTVSAPATWPFRGSITN